MQTQRQHVMCYRRGNRSSWRKTSPPPSKRQTIHQKMQLGYMDSNRPSKPNLLSAPKPSKLLAPTRLRRTFFFSSFLDSTTRPQHQTMQIGSFLTTSQNTKQPSHSDEYGENKVLVKMSFKGLTIERKRVEEFEETLMYRLQVNQSCFTLGFLSQNSLQKLSFICGYKGYLY